jgi:hypothetical protein
LIDNDHLGFLGADLDYSAALSLGLTSYVSASRSVPGFACCRVPEPRYALSQLVLGWERDDRPTLQAQLGPRGVASLNELLATQTWAALRRALWSSTSHPNPSLGFRFLTAERWSEPEETLDQRTQDRRWAPTLAEFPARVELETAFMDRSGNECGQRRLTFLRREGTSPTDAPSYVIEEPNMLGLLTLLGVCGTR